MKPFRRKQSKNAALPEIVSLFCGAGGLDLGFISEKFKIPLAFDISQAAIDTHRRNFANSKSFAKDLVELGAAGVTEMVRVVIPEGTAIGIIGGPPCQGFSRANTRSEPNDPRNQLPFLYLDIIQSLAEFYTIDFVVFENVLGIRDRKHSATYSAIKATLRELNFEPIERELYALDFGVAQTRRRIVLIALNEKFAAPELNVKKRSGCRTVRDAIGHLPSPAFCAPKLDKSDIPVHPNHWTMRPRSAKFNRPQDMTSSSRSFKKLSWVLPSPTIAFGNREIHIHPSGKRRLSILEAMLLQGFPASFVLEGNLSEQVTQISNAVPPPLARSVAAAVKSAITQSR